MRRLVELLLRRGRGEDGAVIVIVAVLLVCFLGAAALAIDLSSGRQAEQRAQAGADAAATAGADQIVATDPTGTPPGSVAAAATNQAAANGACATCVTVDYPYQGSDFTRVGVSISGASAGTVGGRFGRNSIPVSASAVAAAHDLVTTIPGFGDQTLTNTVTTTSTTFTHSSNAILFAADTSCSGGITISGSSGTVITGETFSNGGIHVTNSSGTNFNGSVYYQSGCPNSSIPGARAAAPASGWPEDFTSNAVPLSTICDGNPQSGNITISGGSNGRVNGPICTTGTITITGTSGLHGQATFVANRIIVDHNSGMNITAYYQDLLFYQTGSGQMQITNGSSYPGGTIFVPNGSLLMQGNSGLGKDDPPGYIEAQDITVSNSSGTTISGQGIGAASTSSTTTGLTTSLSVTQTPTTTFSTTSIGSSLVQ